MKFLKFSFSLLNFNVSGTCFFIQCKIVIKCYYLPLYSFSLFPMNFRKLELYWMYKLLWRKQIKILNICIQEHSEFLPLFTFALFALVIWKFYCKSFWHFLLIIFSVSDNLASEFFKYAFSFVVFFNLLFILNNFKSLGQWKE